MPELPGVLQMNRKSIPLLLMAAAAALTPDGEDSVYAQARDVCAITSFYTTSFMLHGHTGGGIGESEWIWVAQPHEGGWSFYSQTMYNTLFFIVINIVILNVIFGIIIDTFADMRDQEAEMKEERQMAAERQAVAERVIVKEAFQL